MPWTAIHEETGDIINLAYLQDEFFNANVFKQYRKGDFVCPTCEGKMHVTKRPNTRIYFAHNASDRNCLGDLRAHIDTENHRECVRVLCKHLREEYKKPALFDVYGDVDIVTEHSFKSIKRRADIAILKDKIPFKVHECQLSRLRFEEVQERTSDYESVGVQCVWHFGLAAAEDKQLMEIFIREYGYVDTPFHIYNAPATEIPV